MIFLEFDCSICLSYPLGVRRNFRGCKRLDRIALLNPASRNHLAQNSPPPAQFLSQAMPDRIHALAGMAGLSHFQHCIADF
jgi:hypothetical protein